jgi:hypothetical protein
MSKKPREAKAKRAPTAKKARATAANENISALTRHTKELNRHSVALATHAAVMTGVSAKQLVYSVLGEPPTLPDTTPLSKLGFDFEALAGLAAAIRARGVNVDTGLVQACKTVADLVKVVSAVMSKR